MYVQHVNLDLIDHLEGEKTTAADLNIVTVLKQHLEVIKTMFVPDILNISEYINLFHTFRRIYGYIMVLLSMFNIVTGVTNGRF